MTVPQKMIDFEALLEEVRQEVVSNVVSQLDLFDDPNERLEAVRAVVALATERDRDRSAATSPLGFDSLIGSYFRAPDQDDPDAEAAWLDNQPGKVIEGMVVNQPFTSPSGATYLVEFFTEGHLTGYQQLVDLDRMKIQRWAFYDTAAWLKHQPATAAVQVIPVNNTKEQ